ncbi:hypothetical protein [Lactobacillus delbrueckii]|uniref:hypothetical protein n=1 Tax=Lactobacillus delbrueckii TaxID=1584 RepID=UPI0039945C9C
MASYGNTVLTGAGIDLVKRVIAKTATFEITRVATSSDSRLTNATISAIEAMTALPSVNQTGTVTAFDTSNDKQVGLKCEFTNQGLTNQYSICGVGIYAKEAGKSEILFAVAPAKEPETMPAKPNDQSALFSFSLNMYVVVGQASAMSITATTEGVVKSINGTIKPDANGNVSLSYYSQAEIDQKISSLSSAIDSLNSSKTNNTDFSALKNRVAANEAGKADKSSVYDKGTADNRYLQRDASSTLKSGALLRWDDSGHANDGNNVPYMAGGLHWDGKTDRAEIRAEETGTDNLDLVFDLGDDGSNNVDFRWNNVSKAKINSSGKFTGHVDWANVDGKDTYSRAEIDSKVSNIQIGGRNLLRNTRTLDSDVWLFREAWPKASYSYQGCQVRGSDVTVWNGFSQYIEVSGGETYVFSIDVKSADGGSYSDAGFYVSLNPDDGYTKAQASGDNEIFTYDADWKRLSFVTHITSNGYIKPRIERVTAARGKIVFARPKLEKGNLATDWSPAPEDLEEGIASTTATANEAKAKAEANANSIQMLSDNINSSGYTSITRTVGVNLDSFIELGSFYFPSSANCVNCPINENQKDDMCVENRKVGGTIIQKCYFVKTYSTVYIRTTSTNGSIWNLWAQINGVYQMDF